MIRFFALFLFIPLLVFSQTETAILSYDVTASMHDRTREITGTIRISMVVKDPAVSQFSFLVPEQWSTILIHDVNNEPIDLERSSSDRLKWNLVAFDRSDLGTTGDTNIFSITFSSLFDSLPSAGVFTAPKEFILMYHRTNSWLPEFASPPAEQLSLRFTAPLQFTVISSVHADTIVSSGLRTWTFVGPHASQEKIFSIFGITNAVKQTAVSPDSLHRITFYSSALRFNQQYAGATAGQLSGALQFFRSITHHEVDSITYVIVGSALPDHAEIDSGAFVLRSNSPAYSVFDSASLTRSLYNPWIIDLARRFCPPTTDSTALFDDGLAGYLASRFLITQYPANSRQERFDALSNALTFFPSGTLSTGHGDRSNTNQIISFRGRYLFFMLEYLLGQESMDSVITRITSPKESRSITFEQLIGHCEAEYGTSLSWFFDQWLRRPSAPEYVLQWKSEKTVRGQSIVKAIIEQRGTLFSMPVPLNFSFGNRTVVKRAIVDQQKQEFTFTFPSAPSVVELDPQLNILRWLLELRISAHAKTALLYLSVNRDAVNAEKEALYTQQLDPNNATGNAPLALFILGNISAGGGNKEKAKEFFLQSAAAASTDETEQYRIFSLVRLGNLLEMDGKRDEAAAYYQRVINEGMKDPVINAHPLTEAERFLREKFPMGELHWFPRY